jgi:phosphoribosylanthranilate isomerase
VIQPGTVKICGLTRIAHVEAAAQAGCDLVGFVNHPPSPRHLDLDDIACLVGRVAPEQSSVLVVVDGSRAELEEALALCGANFVQLCGDQSASDFQDFPVPILRRIAVEDGAAVLMQRWLSVACAFLLDRPGAPGGTGELVETAAAAALCGSAPCLLAGGLGADNVAAQVAATAPLGVDASSKLERSPGEKDAELMADFVAAARAALGRDGARAFGRSARP